MRIPNYFVFSYCLILAVAVTTLSANAQTSEPDDPAASINRLNDLAWQYLEAADYAQAASLLIMATQIAKEAFGENHPAYAASLADLDRLYRAGVQAPAPIEEKSYEENELGEIETGEGGNSFPDV